MITQAKSSVQVHPKVPAMPGLNQHDANGSVHTVSSIDVATSPQPPVIATMLFPDGTSLPPARRLVVLIPEGDVDESNLAQHIWALASPRGLNVLYLGSCKDIYTEALARRYLATLAAITRDAQVRVETRLYVGSDWLPVVGAVWQAGDLLVCHDEQTISSWGMRRKPLGQALVAVLGAPVYVLSGFYPAWPSESSKGMARHISDMMPYAIFLVFLGVQLLIHQTTQATAYTVLMSLSVLAEFGLFGLWYHFFNPSKL